MVANRTREIRLSGMKRGAWGDVAYGGTVNPPRNRKGGCGNPPPKGRRAPVLSQPSGDTFLEFAVWPRDFAGGLSVDRKSSLRTGPPPTPSINRYAELVCIGWAPPTIMKGFAFIPRGATYERRWYCSTDPLPSCLCTSCFWCHIREHRRAKLCC
jgi:hypothetical protein